MQNNDILEIIGNIREWAILNSNGSMIHGIEHWDRVFENGHNLATILGVSEKT